MPPTLDYEPRWYHRGDADTPIIAVLYGAIAISTIWLLEYISGRLLFSKSEGILLSDAAALVTYSSGSLPEFIKWFVKKPMRRKRLCRRALLGLLLRYVIIVADIVILFMSIPRWINVFEYEVGSTQLTFNVQGVIGSLEDLILCKDDQIEYSGFMPDVARQICISGKSGARISNATNYAISMTKGTNQLVISSGLSRTTFRLTHSIRYMNKQGIKSKKMLLRLPDDMVAQTAKAFMNHRFYRGKCSAPKPFPPRNNTVGLKFACTGQAQRTNMAIDFKLVTFLMDVGTEKVNSSSTRKVGKLNRPRLCILPALIVLGVLSMIAVLVVLFRGPQDLPFKQWSYACRIVQQENVDNPLFTPDTELELLPDDYWMQTRPRVVRE